MSQTFHQVARFGSGSPVSTRQDRDRTATALFQSAWAQQVFYTLSKCELLHRVEGNSAGLERQNRSHLTKSRRVVVCCTIKMYSSQQFYLRGRALDILKNLHLEFELYFGYIKFNIIKALHNGFKIHNFFILYLILYLSH